MKSVKTLHSIEEDDISIENMSRTSSAFVLIQEDIPGLDLLVDESSGSMSCGGINPDEASIKDVPRTLSGVAIVTEGV